MARTEKKSFWSDFRRFFLRGVATLLPTVLTIVVLVKCFEFVQQHISVHITEGVIRLVVLSTESYPKTDKEDLTNYINENKPGLDASKKADRGLVSDNPEEQKSLRLWKLRQQWKSGPLSLVGFVLAIVLVYIIGRILASYVGRKLWQFFEMAVQQVPGFKQVYPYVKQVTDFLFGEKKIEFTRVVAVPYPRKDIWSIGLVTGAGFRYMGEKVKEEFLTVFIPSSPTPITGYVIHVKKEEVIDLPISIEEALRFTVSGGVVVPTHQALPTQRIELSPGPAVASPENKGEKGD